MPRHADAPVPPPTELLDRPAKEAARRLALRCLAEVDAAHGRLAGSGDPDALHDFRVALRRLRSTLRVYRPELRGGITRKIRRRLRTVARATGPSRDVEVHLAWLERAAAALTPEQAQGAAWLDERMRTRMRDDEARLRRDAVRRFPRLSRALRTRLLTYNLTVRLDHPRAEPSWATVAGARILDLAEELATELAGVTSASDQTPAHDARIAGKRLRYLLEPLRDYAEEADSIVRLLKTLQDRLGALHDAHVLTRELVDALDQWLGAARGPNEGGTPTTGYVDAEPATAADPRPGLAVLAARLHDDRAHQYAALEAWRHGDSATMRADAAALGARLRDRARAGREIERKFLLSALPAAARDGRVAELEQGYLPGGRIAERVRRVRHNGSAHAYRTIKAGTGISRVEVEEEISPELFEAMWPLTIGRRVRKRRYAVPEGPVVWEIDEFLDRDLVLAEVELRTESQDFTTPHWLRSCLVREVTGEAEYQNASLAR